MITPRQISRDLDGKFTEIVVQTFADRVLVLVSQIGKVGNLIQATIPDTTPLLPAPPPDASEPNRTQLPPPPSAIQLITLLGGAPSEHIQVLHGLYAAQIATILWTEESVGALQVSRRPVVIGLALQNSDTDGSISLGDDEKVVFLGVMSLLQELLSQ